MNATVSPGLYSTRLTCAEVGGAKPQNQNKSNGYNERLMASWADAGMGPCAFMAKNELGNTDCAVVHEEDEEMGGGGRRADRMS